VRAPQFKAIVEKAASAQKPDEKTAASFGAIAMRKQNCGPPMKWREDKFGPGVAADGDKVTHAAGAGQGCALLDVNCSGAGYNAASVLLECSAISSCFIGVVGSNFVHSKLDEPFDTCALAAAVRHDGEVFRKGQNLGPIIKLSELQSGGFVSLELDMQDQELTITVLNKDKGLISSVSVDNVPVEVCVAVSFGKATTAEPQSVRVVGSSSEKVPKKFVKKTGGADLWDDGNAQKLGHEQGSKGGHTAADVAAMMG